MGDAAEKLDDVTAGTADPAIVVDLEEHRRRRSRRSSRTASAITCLSYDAASEPGLYRYTAFGKTVEDTATSNFDQPLRWKGRWFSPVAGGIYDVRARQWSPELGTFLAVDEFAYHEPKATLWSWPNQNPVANADPSGHGKFCFPVGLPPIFWVCLSWPDKPPSPPPSPPPGPPAPPPGPDGGDCNKPKPQRGNPAICKYETDFQRKIDCCKRECFLHHDGQQQCENKCFLDEY